MKYFSIHFGKTRTGSMQMNTSKTEDPKTGVTCPCQYPGCDSIP